MFKVEDVEGFGCGFVFDCCFSIGINFGVKFIFEVWGEISY